jgi:hypothetical protein
MQVESLESRIRQKAQIELNREIDAAASRLEEILHRGRPMMLPDLFIKGDEKATAYGALQSIKKQIYEDRIAKREDDALELFINKVDELQAQIDELKNP